MALGKLEAVSTVDLLEELKRRYNCLGKPEGRYVFLGGPGSGKGTQSMKLKSSHCYCHLSTGDMLREAVAASTPIGLKAKEALDKGELVNDDIVLGLIEEKIHSPECQRGFILDGYPRNIAQANSLTQLLEKSNTRLDGALSFEMEADALVDRVCGRRVHPASGRVYHIKNHPSKVPGFDDLTGEPLIHRKDDNEEVLRKRLSIFNKETAPVISLYQKMGLLYTINAMDKQDAVTQQMYDVVDRKKVQSTD